MTSEYLETIPVIIDPNTGKNVAKNSFRIEEVRDAFSYAYDHLNNSKLLYDKKDLSSSTNLVIDLLCNPNKFK